MAFASFHGAKMGRNLHYGPPVGYTRGGQVKIMIVTQGSMNCMNLPFIRKYSLSTPPFYWCGIISQVVHNKYFDDTYPTISFLKRHLSSWTHISVLEIASYYVYVDMYHTVHTNSTPIECWLIRNFCTTRQSVSQSVKILLKAYTVYCIYIPK